jgi:hypothetical protein
MTDRSMGVADMIDRGMGMASMTDRRMRVAAMNDCRMSMTAVAAARMSAMPMMPAIAAAPTDAGTEIFAAPVPAWAVPTVVVPAIIAAEPDKLRALDHVQAIGCVAQLRRCGHGSRVNTGAHYRHANDKYGRDRNGGSEFTHDNLQTFDQNLLNYSRRELPE